ncbi:hypothetical protein GobsT_42280 [Gemmata obscuriglobus]|uniref:Uncharacterized protein n=1 Tax=Gemmata obscuriglobus TaxID=114 RepID=A0A2Z3H2H0_9BACT|nr:hypothetical protein [Gemmata obscuriglobus]AWM37756.1 hypothetical protein C1280_12630 [Gemmata obscuriglobus]QEG29432.1 hypothetical protein GobsT_42280 [Gemmata obscuriglobus]VTS08538.1 unnamed protein product [Gemmata obscuriglobus UQM 2246]
MIDRNLAASLFVLGVCCCSPIVGRSANQAEPGGVTIEFQDTAALPNVKYSLKVAIEFADGRKLVAVKLELPAGSTGTHLSASLAGSLKAQGGWECTLKDNKVVLTTWKDQKTGIVHTVKNIIFTSDDLPKTSMPKVTRPGLKG